MTKYVGFFTSKIKKVSAFLKYLILVTFVLLFTTELSLRLLGFYTPTFPVLWSPIFSSLLNKDLIDENLKQHKQVSPAADYLKQKNYLLRTTIAVNFDYGIGLFANCNCRDILVLNNRLVWDVVYNIDNLARRETPESKKISADEFAVVYGGSRAFGFGVNDEDTLPNNLQKLTSEYKVYNYAIPAAGANIFLKMHQQHVFKEIEQKKGIFIYVYDFGNASRMLGSKEATSNFSTPYYDLNENEKLVHVGNFWSERFLKTTFFYFGAMSAIYQNTFLKSSFFSEANLKMDEIKIIKSIFLEMKKEAEAINGSKLAVVFFEPFVGPQMENVSRALRESGIEILIFDKTHLPPYNDGNYYFQGDGHPTSATYNLQAQLIFNELKKRKLLNGR